MRWTRELDALLNQCVFECGYDFTAGAELLMSRARQLRLVSGDERIVLTSDECQVRWMEINPVVEEDDEDGGDPGDEDETYDARRSFHDDDFYQYHLQRDATLPYIEESRPEAVEQHVENAGSKEPFDNEVRPVEATAEPSASASVVADIPEGCPRLELSLSDADLDALLNSLPATVDSLDASVADSKREPAARGVGSSSEMQWVLSFLSNPDEVAHHDAEAKNMLCDAEDRSEDDNFQYFLQQLNHANLMSPEKPGAATASGAGADETVPRGVDADTTSDEEEDSDDDWVEVRKQIKTAGPSRVDTSTTTARTGHIPSHKRRLEPKASHVDEVLPPAAPLRFPPRTELAPAQAENGDDVVSQDSDDNGLDALPRYEPPPSASSHLQPPPRTVIRPTAASSSKLLALSQEIGQQLRKNGEFQFPKRLFRDLDCEPSIEADCEQVPEDDP